jgi:hypothetical protein
VKRGAVYGHGCDGTDAGPLEDEAAAPDAGDLLVGDRTRYERDLAGVLERFFRERAGVLDLLVCVLVLGDVCVAGAELRDGEVRGTLAGRRNRVGDLEQVVVTDDRRAVRPHRLCSSPRCPGR